MENEFVKRILAEPDLVSEDGYWSPRIGKQDLADLKAILTDHATLTEKCRVLTEALGELRAYVNEYEPRLLMDFDDQAR
jgi:hypothetical protein